MSSFTEASFEPALDAGGKPKRSEGRAVYAIRGRGGNGFDYDIGFLGSGLKVHVREGFETDGPSRPTLKSPGLLAKLAGVAALVVPRGAWEKAMKSAAVHDLLREDERFTLLEGDAVFLMAMEAEGTPAFWREVFFKAVRTNTSRAKRNPEYLPTS